jgi:hypothetical protein
LIDLPQLTDDKIKQFGLAAIMALVMKYISTGEIKDAIALLAKWGAFDQAAQLADFIRAMIQYFLNKANTKGHADEVTALLAHTIPQEEENIMDIARQPEDRGIKKGEKIRMKKHAYAMATNMLEAGESDLKIRQYTGMSCKEIEHLKANLH